MKTILLITLAVAIIPAAATERTGWLCDAQAASTFRWSESNKIWQSLRLDVNAKYLITPSTDDSTWWVNEISETTGIRPNGLRKGQVKLVCVRGPDVYGRLDCTGFGGDSFHFRADTFNYVFVQHEYFFMTPSELDVLAARTEGKSRGFSHEGPIIEVGFCRSL